MDNNILVSTMQFDKKTIKTVIKTCRPILISDRRMPTEGLDEKEIKKSKNLS